MTGFEHPEYLYFLAGIPGLLLLYAGWRSWRKRALDRLGDRHLFDTNLPAEINTFWRTSLWSVGLALLVIAWANPLGGRVQKTEKHEGVDVMIAIDISNSMLARDVSPNRLELAKLFARQLIDALPGNRVGLIFFAGEAALQMPVSADLSAAKMLLRNAEPAVATVQGTNLAQAIALGQRSLRSGTAERSRAIVLITDGEDHEGKAEEIAKDAYSEGTVIFVVGAGTPQGGPIPLGQFGHKRDDRGNPVVSKLNTVMIGKLAGAGGGESFDLRRSQTALNLLVNALNHLEKRTAGVVTFTEAVTYYQWLLLPGWLLLLLIMWLPTHKPAVRKKKVKKAAAAIMLLAFCSSAYAQSGDRKYDRSLYKDAEKAYQKDLEQKKDPAKSLYNLGNAQYQQSKFDEAAKQFEQAAQKPSSPYEQADIWHNLGNARFKQQQYEGAVKAYEQSLRLRPGDPDAKKNLVLAKKQLEQQQNKQQDQQQPQNSPQKEEQKPQQGGQTPVKDQPADQQQPGARDMEDARRFLENAVEPEDQRNAKLYKEGEPKKRSGTPEKDW